MSWQFIVGTGSSSGQNAQNEVSSSSVWGGFKEFSVVGGR